MTFKKRTTRHSQNETSNEEKHVPSNANKSVKKMDEAGIGQKRPRKHANKSVKKMDEAGIGQKRPRKQFENDNKQEENVELDTIKDLDYNLKPRGLKLRITSMEMKTIDKAYSKELLSIQAIDENNDEIEIIAWGKAATKTFDNVLENHCYMFKNLKVQKANPKYKLFKTSVQLQIQENSFIAPFDDDLLIPKNRYNTLSMLSEIENQVAGTFVDIAGVPFNIGLPRTAGKSTKVDFWIADGSKQVKVTLWNEKQRQTISRYVGQLIVLKNTQIRVFGQYRSLNGGTILLPVEKDEALKDVVDWRETHKDSLLVDVEKLPKLSLVTIEWNLETELDFNSVLQMVNLFDHTTPPINKYFRLECEIAEIQDPTNMWYTAVPDGSSKKKVVENEDGKYFCESTGVVYNTCTYMWNTVLLVKETGSTDKALIRLKIMGEIGDKLWGKTATEMLEEQQKSRTAYSNMLNTALGQIFMFGLRENRNTYMGKMTQVFFVEFMEEKMQ